MQRKVMSYNDPLIWQRGVALVEAVNVLSASLPADERFGLTAQMRRAAVHAPSNVAEGSGRQVTGEYRHPPGTFTSFWPAWRLPPTVCLAPPASHGFFPQSRLVPRASCLACIAPPTRAK